MSENVLEGNEISPLLEALRNDPECGEAFRESEAVEQEVLGCVEDVDLDVMFSPVVMWPGGKIEDAVEVSYKGEDGRYVFDNPLRIVDRQQLRVMRARYLILRGRSTSSLSEIFGTKGKHGLE